MTESAVNSTAGENKWGDLGVRALSAVLLIPAVLLDIWLGGIWFELFAAFLGVLIAHEWTIIGHGRSSAQFALHAAAAMSAAFLPGDIGVFPSLAVIVVLTALSIVAMAWSKRPKNLWTYVGVPYVALPVLSLVQLRQDATWGVHAIMWLMLMVWATDTFAYFAGRMIGGAKLAPLLSPKKTWAGLLGGMAGAAVISVVYALWFLPTWQMLALVAAALAALAQGGDIFESAFKRFHDVKDSGALIPGHGGVLDRVDGLLVAVVAAAFVGFARDANSLARGLLLW